MFRRIAGFEFRYQMRNPIFWVALVLFALLGFAFAATPAFPIGGGNIHRNSAIAVLRLEIAFNLFYMFITAAFVANVVVRDDETGFGAIVRSTPVTRFQYLIGRFAGAGAASLLAWLVIPLALWFGSLMPWLDPDTLGPTRVTGYLYGILVFGLPDVLITAAIFFAAATLTRSMMWTYVCVIVFAIAWWTLVTIGGQRPEYGDWFAAFEPFGAVALARTTRYWTPAEINNLLPALKGGLLLNRLLWSGIGAAFLALAVNRYRFAEAGASDRKADEMAARERGAPQSDAPLPDARPRSATMARFRSRMALEMQQVFRSPAFAILLALGALNSAVGLWFGRDIFGTPTLPLAHNQIPLLKGSFALFPIIIAIYYAGELVWRERDRRMNEIVDATPLPDWAYVIPKTAAVAAVLISSLIFSMVVSFAINLAKGWPHFELGEYLLWYLPGMSFVLIAFAVLAVFVQSLSPNKYIGWGVMALYFVASIVLPLLGFEHNLYQFPDSPPEPLSGMNGAGTFWIGAWWFHLYWGAFCILLLVASHLLWRRGTETRLMPRLRRVPRRLNGAPGVIAAAALAVFVASGIWIFYNTNVLNHYRTSTEDEKFLADYEKKYLKYETLPQPVVSNVMLNVALYPREAKAVTNGRYVLTNLTHAAIPAIHVRQNGRNLEMLAVAVQGGRLQSEDRKFGYRIYRLDKPMQPGETRTMTFTTRRWQRGFRNGANDTKVVANGTFLNNFDIAPTIGMNRSSLLQDRARRRHYDLPPELRPARLEDLSATDNNYIGAGWTLSDIIVSTEADQVPIAPGTKVSESAADGRRIARFVSDAPILNFFSIQSARYAQRHRLYKGIDLAIYYHPPHFWNVDRMLDALQRGLDYYQANFGPYQFKQVRILEFPDYAAFAQSFANTIPYSESIGFIADTRDPDKIDYVTYVTAHELGHQWWAHQIVGARMQGATMLSETLAQYSALMVMKHLYGPDKMRRFLKFELDTYLRARATEAHEEEPLERVENQQYIHYNKGSLVMYLLQERLGEDAVNRAIRTILNKYRFKGAPYPRSVELVDAFRNEARTPEDKALVADLFERITIYDLKVMAPTAKKRADGKWDVTVPVDAHKYYAGGKGDEKEALLSDRIQIGLFTAMPGRGRFDRSNVIRMAPMPVHGGRQIFRFVTDRKPNFAGVDPYNFYIDRNSEDNVAPVT